MRKAAISASAFALVAPLLLVGTASQANAATSCYASSCTGLAAASTTCVNDAEIIYSVNIIVQGYASGNVQLKYSPSCRATWARVIGNKGEIASVTKPSLVEYCTSSGVDGTGCNTAMINDANMKSEAYGYVYLGGYGGTAFAVTPTF